MLSTPRKQELMVACGLVGRVSLCDGACCCELVSHEGLALRCRAHAALHGGRDLPRCALHSWARLPKGFWQHGQPNWAPEHTYAGLDVHVDPSEQARAGRELLVCAWQTRLTLGTARCGITLSHGCCRMNSCLPPVRSKHFWVGGEAESSFRHEV